mgnify:FL=1
MPEIVGFEIIKFVVPWFVIEKVLVIVPIVVSISPKFVQSAVEGDVSPFEIETPFPSTSISGLIVVPLILKL